jgi:hypothetical protein
MGDGIKKLISEIQGSMLESANSCFEKSELDDLRCLIRVTGEFMDFLQTTSKRLGTGDVTNAQTRPTSGTLPFIRSLGPGQTHPTLGSVSNETKSGNPDLRYVIETVFSGVDSFCNVSAAYRMLAGARNSRIDWEGVPKSKFKEQFESLFHEFAGEPDFEKQCRLLLDLFKLEIAFAGFSYD